MNPVPFLELKPAYLELRDEFDAAYHRVMDSGWFLLGEELNGFEGEYAEYSESSHCVGVGSGLDALQIALKAYGIGPGDEVIVPAHTFIATWLAVTYTGATLVPIEPDPKSYNIDVNRIESAITVRTKAIIPVHLYGQTADMDPIMEIANRRGIVVIEDAAQSQGALYKGRKAGSLGHAAAHSFYPGKNLGAFGDGGAVTTNDPEIAHTVRVMRNYGTQKKYHYEMAGMNSRLDELQSAFLRIRLNHLDEWNCRRSTVARNYCQQLESCNVVVPHCPSWADAVWHLFVVQFENRDQAQFELGKKGIGTLIHYPIPAHRTKCYENNGFDFEITDSISKRVLSLPIGPHLTEASQQLVIDSVTDYAR